MGKPYRSTVCEDCDTAIVRRVRPDKPTLCAECALRRATLAAQQMAAKSGPAWERWLASNGPAGKKPGGNTEG